MYLHSHFSPDNLIDFSKIKWEDFLPAMEQGKKLAEERIKKIKEQEPSFQHTILELENAKREMNQTFSILMCLLEANKDLDKVEMIDEVNEKLQALDNALNNDISFDMDLFLKVKEVYESAEQLSALDKKLTKIHYQDFIDSGVNLPKEVQDRLREISDRTSALEIKIESNVQEEPTHWKVKVQDITHLEGLSPSFIAEAKMLAEENNFDGWMIAINEATFGEVASFASYRPLRLEVTNLFRSRGNNNDKFDNKVLIAELLKLRHEEAKLLGFESPSHLTLKDRMIKKPEDALQFLEDLNNELRPSAEYYFNIIKDLAKAEEVEEVTQGDHLFYQTLATGKLLDMDMNELKHFFPYQQVWSGLQSLTEKLFNVRFERIEGASTWHSDVEVYKAIRGNTNIGLLYLDVFTRETKTAGAWMNNLVANGPGQLPIIIVAGNFSKNEEDGVVLLSDMIEVRTLFHEIGHAIHGLCSEVPYTSLAGTNVAWDFVELPSQIMENFTYTPEVLDLITCHYKTKSKIPKELREKITQSQKLFASYVTLTYTGQAYLDLSLHIKDKEFDLEWCENLLAWFWMTKRLPNAARTTNFTHIWGSGYDSGYYSYIWANVLDSDCFESFLEAGVLNSEMGEKFRKEILATGSSRDEMESFIAFKGRKPEVQALVKKIT